MKVQNLQPADVELNEVRWEVFEDDPDLYAGLINCARYTSDGLSGEVYLNYSASGSNNPPVPGASGHLEGDPEWRHPGDEAELGGSVCQS